MERLDEESNGDEHKARARKSWERSVCARRARVRGSERIG